MSAIAYAPPISAWNYSSRATGEDATELDKQFREHEQSASVSLLPSPEILSTDLWSAYVEAGSKGWAGPGSTPTSPEHLRVAIQFLESIPVGWPHPDVAVDPDGEFDFEWRIDKDHVVSVSVGLGGRLSYAGLFGRSRVHGVEYLVMGSVSPVLESVRRLYREGGSPCPA